MDIKIIRLDEKYFPRTCCGKVYKNCKTYMDHFLPAHMAARDKVTPNER